MRRAAARRATASCPARRRSSCPARDKLKLKDPEDFRLIGRGETHLVDGPDIVAGSIGIDMVFDGLLYAVVARPTVLGDKVLRFDDTGAKAVPGVVAVVPIESSPPPVLFNPLGGMAVVATSLGSDQGPRGTEGRVVGRQRARELRLFT